MTATTTWPLIWDSLPAATDHSTAIRSIRTALSRRKEMLDALASIPNERRARRMSRRYMQSASARLACLAIAAHRRFSAKTRDACALELVEAIQLVRPWHRAVKPMVAFPKEKLDGKIRRVFRSGLVDYAAQLLVRDAACALTRPEPAQFMSDGGLPQFEQWLRAELPASHLVITTDIPSCFDRVLRDAVVDGLPLPGKVMEEVLFRPMDRAVYLERTPSGGLAPIHKETVAQVSSSKRGIPQGSAASSVASERVIGRIVRRVQATSPDVSVATYGDNLIILLRDAAAKQLVIHALTSEVEACFGHDVINELTLRTRIRKPNAWFTFCGRDYKQSGSKLGVRISADRILHFGTKAMIDADDAISAKDRAHLLKIDQRVADWIRRNAQFKGVVEEGLEVIAFIRKSALYNQPPAAPVAEPPN